MKDGYTETHRKMQECIGVRIRGFEETKKRVMEKKASTDKDIETLEPEEIKLD